MWLSQNKTFLSQEDCLQTVFLFKQVLYFFDIFGTKLVKK